VLEFVTGCKVARVKADVSTLIEGRRVNDDFNALIQLESGAPGVISASQVATGEGNGLRLRIYGEKGALEWNQEAPDRLTLSAMDGPIEIVRSGSNNAMLTAEGRAACRLPIGHPEGFIGALGNIYRDFAKEVRERGSAPTLPSIVEGVRGLRFVETVIRSSQGDLNWVDLPT
jgi:predicted dehydrogenase